MPGQLTVPLLTLFVASLLCYVGMHTLWGGTGGYRSDRSRLRGLLLAAPLILVAAMLASRGYAWIGISILTTGAAVILTLGLGVCATSLPGQELMDLSAARMVLPVCLVVLLAGMSGELTLIHALMIACVAGVSLWAAEPVKLPERNPIHGVQIFISAFCFIGWMIVLKLASDNIELPLLQRIAPIIVALWILAIVGLLAGDVQARMSSSATGTVSTAAIGLLGIGLPIVIFCGTFIPRLLPTSETDTQVIMTQPTWRIDCMLLAVVSGLLFHTAGRKSGIGKPEGLFLITICVIFMFVTVWNVRS